MLTLIHSRGLTFIEGRLAFVPNGPGPKSKQALRCLSSLCVSQTCHTKEGEQYIYIYIVRVLSSIPSSRARRSLRHQEIAPRINFLLAILCSVVAFILRHYDCSKVMWRHRPDNIGDLQSCCIGWFV